MKKMIFVTLFTMMSTSAFANAYCDHVNDDEGYPAGYFEKQEQTTSSKPCVSEGMSPASFAHEEVENMLVIASVAQPDVAARIYRELGMGPTNVAAIPCNTK